MCFCVCCVFDVRFFSYFKVINVVVVLFVVRCFVCVLFGVRLCVRFAVFVGVCCVCVVAVGLGLLLCVFVLCCVCCVCVSVVVCVYLLLFVCVVVFVFLLLVVYWLLLLFVLCVRLFPLFVGGAVCCLC